MGYKRSIVKVPYMNDIMLDCPSWDDGRGLIVIKIHKTYVIDHHTVATQFPVKFELLREAKKFLDLFYDQFSEIDWTVDNLQEIYDRYQDKLTQFHIDGGLDKLKARALYLLDND